MIPTKDQFKALLKLPKDQPVSMVNLLKFKEVADGGQESGAEESFAATQYLRDALTPQNGIALLPESEALLDELEIDQPQWAHVTDVTQVDDIVERLGGFPVLVRPSYVLSGAAMSVAHSDEELDQIVGLRPLITLRID